MTAAKKVAAPTAKRTGSSTKKALRRSPRGPLSKSSKNSKKATPTPKKAAIPTKPATKKITPAAKKAAPKVRAPGAIGGPEEPACSPQEGSAEEGRPVLEGGGDAGHGDQEEGGAGQGRRIVPAAPPKRPTGGPYAKDAKFFDEQRALLLEARSIYSGQAVDLRAEADSLALEREPGDVQFDEESGEGGTVTVDRERNLALPRPRRRRRWRRSTTPSARSIASPTADASGAIRAIPKGLRLRALPFARLCVACKSGGLSRR